jgi:hypothetical protein
MNFPQLKGSQGREHVELEFHAAATSRLNVDKSWNHAPAAIIPGTGHASEKRNSASALQSTSSNPNG